MNKSTTPPPPPKDGFDPQPKHTTGPRLGRIHDRVLHVLAEVDSGAAADRALANAFRRARDLGARERHQIKEEVYGLLRRRRLAQDALYRSLKVLKKDPKLFDAPIGLRLEILAHLILEGSSIADIKTRDDYASRRVPQLFDRILKETQKPKDETIPSSIERAAISVSLPTWIYQNLVNGLGKNQADTIAKALLERAPFTLRVDEHRISRNEVLSELHALGLEAHPTTVAPHGIVVGSRTDLSQIETFQDAKVEVQDEGSQLIAHAAQPQPGERILDACAGAGGKTLALWAAMHAKGQLVAVEPDKKKYDVLRRRLKSHAPSIELHHTSLDSLPTSMHGTYDRILVDAPCTGTGTLRRHPDLKWRLKPEDLKAETARQIHLLGAAMPLLKPQGVLIYATCSVLREENEAIAEDIVHAAPELNPLPLERLWGTELSRTLGAESSMVRIGPGPGPSGPDGFFIAAFQRK